MSVTAESVGNTAETRGVPALIARARGAAAVSYAAVFASYGVLVLVMWVPFGTRNGMPYETAFPYASETTSWFDGFFYRADDLRPYTSVFYHLSYLISEATGHTGSFLAYQLVYAGLWFGRGVLVFLILAALFNRTSLIAYLGGALTIAHASDEALNWVGQMNQFGMIFWLLLSLWLFVRSLLSSSVGRSLAWMAGALVAARLCLWSYESPLFIMILVPAALLVFRRDLRTRRNLAFTGLYYVVPVYYVTQALERYLGGASSYQSTVVRDDISVGQLLGDLAFNVRTSVSFWNWGEHLPPVDVRNAAILGAIALAGVVLGGLLVCRPDEATRSERPRSLLVLAGLGALILLASFPAYLILTSSRQIWRTQFLSGVGFAVLLAALITVSAGLLRERRRRLLAALLGGGVVAFFGAGASYRAAHFHHGVWVRHKDAIEHVLEVAPRVEPNAVIAYTGVPAKADPFGDTMWFDLALRLAYPHTPVAGVYFRNGGRPAPGQALALRRGYWESTGKGFPPLLRHVPLDHTLFIAYGRRGSHLQKRVPPFLASGAAAEGYEPQSVIVRDRPDVRAVRRYGRIDTPEETDGR
jgi:hypothetical protein